MLTKEQQEQIRFLLRETVTLLCKNGLPYRQECCVEALIGVTLDKRDLLLVSINENVMGTNTTKPSPSKLPVSSKNVIGSNTTKPSPTKMPVSGRQRGRPKGPLKRYSCSMKRRSKDSAESESDHEIEDPEWTPEDTPSKRRNKSPLKTPLKSNNSTRRASKKDTCNEHSLQVPPSEPETNEEKVEEPNCSEDNGRTVHILESMHSHEQDSELESADESMGQSKTEKQQDKTSDEESEEFSEPDLSSSDGSDHEEDSSLAMRTVFSLIQKDGTTNLTRQRSGELEELIQGEHSHEEERELGSEEVKLQPMDLAESERIWSDAIEMVVQREELKKPQKKKIKRKEKPAEEKTAEPTSPMCHICGKTMSSARNLTKHVRRHMGTYTFNCQQCGKGFFDKTDMDVHIAKHENRKLYQCHICGRSYSHNKGLRKHIKKEHEGMVTTPSLQKSHNQPKVSSKAASNVKVEEQYINTDSSSQLSQNIILGHPEGPIQPTDPSTITFGTPVHPSGMDISLGAVGLSPGLCTGFLSTPSLVGIAGPSCIGQVRPNLSTPPPAAHMSGLPNLSSIPESVQYYYTTPFQSHSVYHGDP